MAHPLLCAALGRAGAAAGVLPRRTPRGGAACGRPAAGWCPRHDRPPQPDCLFGLRCRWENIPIEGCVGGAAAALDGRDCFGSTARCSCGSACPSASSWQPLALALAAGRRAGCARPCDLPRPARQHAGRCAAALPRRQQRGHARLSSAAAAGTALVGCRPVPPLLEHRGGGAGCQPLRQ